MQDETDFLRGQMNALYDQIETLRAENAKLIAERDELKEQKAMLEIASHSILDTVKNFRRSCALLLKDGEDRMEPDMLSQRLSDLNYERRALLAEREAMMKQEPVGYIVKDTKNNLEWLTTIQNPEKYKRDYPDFALTPVCASSCHAIRKQER